MDKLIATAVLNDDVYRRALDDTPVKRSVLGEASTLANVQTALPTRFAVQSLQDIQYFYTSTGFSASVTVIDGTVFLTFRGSDSAEAFLNGFVKAAGAGMDQYAADNSSPGLTSDGPRKSDIGDWVNNALIGNGTSRPSQATDALDLAQAVKAVAGSMPIVVAGQSLGGGLAAVVGSVMGLEAYVSAPAPFGQEIRTQAAMKAAKGVILEDGRNLFDALYPIHYQLPVGPEVGVFAAGFLKQKTFIETLINDGLLTGVSNANLTAYFTAAQQQYEIYLASERYLVHVNTMKGEALTQGVGTSAQFLSNFGVGAIGIQSVDTTLYDLGMTSSELSTDIQAKLHNQSVHGLAITTRFNDPSQSFESLLRDSRTLRDGMFDDAISGRQLHGRIDPGQGGVYGYSMVDDTGMSINVMMRSLWNSALSAEKTFYNDFYQTFDLVKNLSGIAGVATLPGVSVGENGANPLHNGVTWLMLENVRDSLGSQTLNGKPYTLSGGAMQIDRSSGGKGADTIDSYVTKFIEAAAGLNRPDKNELASMDMYIPKMASLGIVPWGNNDWHFENPWNKVVIRSGNGSLDYDGNGTAKLLVIGNLTGSRIGGGDNDDILLGNANDDTFLGDLGEDLIVGASGIDTVDYSTSNAGVNIDLTRSLNGIEKASVQHGGHAEGDILIGIERIIGAKDHSNSFKGTDGHEEFVGGSKADVFKLTKGVDKFIGGAPDDANDTKDVIDVSGYVQAEDLPARGFDIDLRAGTVKDRTGSTNLAELVGIDGAIGSIHDDRFVALTTGGTFHGGLGWDTLYLTGSWASYSFQYNYPGYECRIYDANGNECLVNSVESFVFGGLSIDSLGQRLSFGSLANLAPSEIFLGTAKAGRNVATVVYNDEAPDAWKRTGDVTDDQSGGHATMSVAQPEASDYVRESATVQGGTSEVRQFIGHVTVFDRNKFDVVNVKLDARSVPFFELDGDGSLYLKAGVGLDYAAWKAVTDPMLAGITMSDPAGQGMLNYQAAAIAAQVGDRYVAHLVATDSKGATTTGDIAFKIGPPPPNRAPGETTLSSKYMPDWVYHGYEVGRLSTIDPDGDDVTWSLPQGSPFLIVDDKIIVNDPSGLVLGPDGKYHISVTASDGTLGTTTDIVLKKNVPVALALQLEGPISELTAVGSIVGTIIVSDPDADQSITVTSAASDYLTIQGNEIILTKSLVAKEIAGLVVSIEATDGYSTTYASGEIAVTEANIQPGDVSGFSFSTLVTEVEERAEPIDGNPVDRADIKVGTITKPAGFVGRIEIEVDGQGTDSSTFEIRNDNEVWIKGDARLDREAFGPDGLLKFHIHVLDLGVSPPTRGEIPTSALQVTDVDEGFRGITILGGIINEYVGNAPQASIVVDDPDIYAIFEKSITQGGDILEFVPGENGLTNELRVKEGAYLTSSDILVRIQVTEANGRVHEQEHTFSTILMPKPELIAETIFYREDLAYDSDVSQPFLIAEFSLNSRPGDNIVAQIPEYGYGSQIFDLTQAANGNWQVYLKAGLSTSDIHQIVRAEQGDFPFLFSQVAFQAQDGRSTNMGLAVHMSNAPDAYLDWQRPLYDPNITANHPDGKELGRIEIFNDSPYSTYELVGDIAEHVWMTKEGNFLVFDWIAGQTYAPGAFDDIQGSVRIHNSWSGSASDSSLSVLVHDVQVAQPVSIYMTNLVDIEVSGLMSEGIKVADIHFQGEGSGEYAFSFDGYGDQVVNVRQDVDGNWGLYLRDDRSMAQIHQAMRSSEGWYDYALQTNVTVHDLVRNTSSSTLAQIMLGSPPSEQIDWSNYEFNWNPSASLAPGTIVGRFPIIGASPFITYELTGNLAQRVSMSEDASGDLVLTWLGQSAGPIIPDMTGSLRIVDSWWESSYDAMNFSMHVDAPTVDATNLASLSYATDPSQHVKVADLTLGDWSSDISITFDGYGAQILDAIKGPDGNWAVYLKDNLTMDQIHRAMKLGDGSWDYALNTSVIVRDNVTGIEVAESISASVANPSLYSFDMTRWSYDGNLHYNAPNGTVLGSVPLSPGQGWTFSLSGDLADNMDLAIVNGKLQINWLPGQSFAYPDNTYETGSIVATSSWWDTSYEIKQFSYMITPFEAPNDIRLSTNYAQNASNISATSSSGKADLATVFLDGIGWWNQSRESHIHLTTDTPSIFKLSLDPVSYVQKLSIKEGASLMPGRTYSTTLTAWDDMFPDVGPVTETVSFQVKNATVGMYGASGDWGSYLVGTLTTDDPFDSRSANGGPDQYYYSIVGGRDDIFDIVGNKLVAPNGMNSQTDANALIQILTESNYGFSRVDTYSIDIDYYYGAYHSIHHIL